MATFSTTEVAAITDYLGATYKQLLAIADSSEGQAVLTGADDIVTYLEGLSLAKADVLADAALTLKAEAATPYMAASKFAGILNKLRADLAGWDVYAAAQSVVFYDYFCRLVAAASAGSITPTTYAFPDLTTLATFSVTGATTGTFSGTGGPLDMTKVAPQQLQLEVTTDIGAGALAVTVTCQKSDGTTESKVVNVSSGAVAGTKYDVGTSSNLYKDATAISISGGTSGAFRIQNKLPRTAPAV